MIEQLDSLLQWLQTFHLPTKPSSIDELLDGIICAQILNQIASDYFTSDWISKLASGSNADDWRNRESNWRKIVERLSCFYEDVIGFTLHDQIKPSLRELSTRGDKTQLAAVLRLILGAAVNCEMRQMYIQNIVQLDVQVQQRLMEIIQELMQGEGRDKNDKPTTASTNAMFDSLNFEQTQKQLQTQLSEAVEQLSAIQRRYEALQEKNYELEQVLNEEYRKRKQLSCENEQLNEKLGRLENKNKLESNEDHLLHDQHVQKLQTRLEHLERELLKTEMQREECLMRVDLLEKELASVHSQNEQLMRKVKEAEMLKDELDIHRHSADKIANYEQKLEAYKQKLEELLDQRKQFKMVEEKNHQLLESNVRLESELKKTNALKLQVSEYKKQMQELHQQVLEKTHHCDKTDFELQKLNEQFNVLLQDKERLQKEKLELKSRLQETLPTASSFSLEDELEELHDASVFSNQMPNLGFEITSKNGAKLKEEIDKLEQENCLLREKLENQNSDEILLLRTNCEDSKVRIQEMEQANRTLNKKIIELESTVDQLHQINLTNEQKLKQSKSVRNESSFENDELNGKVNELQQTVERLNQELASKQNEINEVEAKYRRYIEKAKKAVNVLEPLSLNLQQGSTSVSMLPNFMSTGNCSMPIPSPSFTDANNLNVEELRALLANKDAQLIEIEKQKSFLEFENRLMTTAFHKFAFDLQRKAATQRVQGNASISHNFENDSMPSLSKATSNSSLSSSSGSSLLNKHRQATTRKFGIDRLTNVKSF